MGVERCVAGMGVERCGRELAHAQRDRAQVSIEGAPKSAIPACNQQLSSSFMAVVTQVIPSTGHPMCGQADSPECLAKGKDKQDQYKYINIDMLCK